MRAHDPFDFDVFLSYGWADNRNADVGDRGWVGELKRQLENEVGDNLGSKARIFLDVEQANNGELRSNLEAAIRGSALFLSILTPGSCKPESWCRWEVDQFVRFSDNSLPDHKQVFSAILRNVDRGSWPDPLPAIVPYEFMDDSGPLPKPDLADSRTPAGKQVRRLAHDIAEALKGVAGQISRTVFLTGSPLYQQVLNRLSVEITRRGGTAIRLAVDPEESQEDYARRCDHALRRSGLSVHLVDTRTDEVRPGWSDSPQMTVLRAAVRRFGSDDREKRVVIWQDTMEDPEVAPEAVRIARVLKGTGIEDLESLLRHCLKANTENTVEPIPARIVASAQLTPPVQTGAAAAMPARKSTPYVFVECVREDLEKLDPLRAALQSQGILVRPPLFQGDLEERRRLNENFLKGCHGVVVYFGARNDVEAVLACDSLYSGLNNFKRDVPKAVLLDPHTDTIRRNFFYPEFTNYPSSAIEGFIQQVREVAR